MREQALALVRGVGDPGQGLNLLHEAKLSARPEEKLAIKLEIDTRPPAGARCERRIVTRHVTFLVQHHDLPSLLAGKLHAVLTRPYAKGRDWRMKALDLKAIRDDVGPFLERPEDAGLLTRENLQGLLREAAAP